MIVTQEDIFDSNFSLFDKYEKSRFVFRFLEFCNTSDLIDKETCINIYDSYKDTLTIYVESLLTDDDYEDDIVYTNSKRLEELMYILDTYFMSLKPSEVIKELTSGNLVNTIKVANEYFYKKQNYVVNSIQNIKNNNKVIYSSVYEIKQFIDSLYKAVINCGYSQDLVSYTMVNCETLVLDKVLYMDEIMILLNILQSELSLLNKFSTDDLLRVLESYKKSMFDSEYTYCQSFVNTVILMYIFSEIYSTYSKHLYMDEKIFTQALCDLKEKRITSSVIENALKYGVINFSEEDIDYLNNNFLNTLSLDELEISKTLINK